MSQTPSVGNQYTPQVNNPPPISNDRGDVGDAAAIANAQETRGTDTRIASANTGTQIASSAINSQKVDALKQELLGDREMRSRDLADKIHNLSVPERNSLITQLGADGRKQLATDMYMARTRNPAAYQSMVRDMTNGIPPAQIKSLIDAGMSFNTKGNPVGQDMAQRLTHDIAAEVGKNGTKGQKLGLIDSMTDPKVNGLATSSKIGADAVGELFKGLKGDKGAVDTALKMMSQSDKANVAKAVLATDDAAGIKQTLRNLSVATDSPQKAQMLEQFMTQLDSVHGDKKQAALDGITATILKSPNGVLSALRVEDQTSTGSGKAMSTYIANVLESGSPQVLQVMMTALKYGDNLGGRATPDQLERLDSSRFNAPDKQNASTRGYFVGSFDKALARLEKEGKEANNLSRNAFGSGVDVLKTVLSNTPVVKEFKVAIDLGATGLKAANTQFNNAAQLDATSVYQNVIDLGRPTIPGRNGTPQLPEQGNSPAYENNVNRSDRTP